MRKLSFLSTTNNHLCSNSFIFPLTVQRKVFFPNHKWSHNMVTATQPISTTTTTIPRRRSNKKIVVIMGATGCGKSKLSIDLATRFFPSEVINSDKIQVYNGLNITTNKISMPERRGVPHHLLGEFNASKLHPEFSPLDFRSAAACRINEIVNRGKTPLIVGGSNSFIYALLAKQYNPEVDFLEPSNPVNLVTNELRYRCCFIWVDVSGPVLNQYLDKRVDEMLNSGMIEELQEFFKNEGFSCSNTNSGIRKAIGVPEFEKCLKGEGSYEDAGKDIKENTRILAERQVGKIMRLKQAGWDLQRVDATAVFAAAMSSENFITSESGKEMATGIWEEHVLEPSAKIVKQFLLE